MPFFVRDAGAWKEVGTEGDTFSVRDAGSWKTVQAAWVRDAGSWKQFYTQLAVSLAGTTGDHSQTAVGSQCSAGVTIANTGIEFAWGADGDTTGASQGNWLDAGTTAQVWVRVTEVSGSVSGTTDTWLATTTTRSWGITDVTDNATPVTAEITVELASDSGGSNILDTATYNLSANFA